MDTKSHINFSIFETNPFELIANIIKLKSQFVAQVGSNAWMIQESRFSQPINQNPRDLKEGSHSQEK
jgi:hypothetical protein